MDETEKNPASLPSHRERVENAAELARQVAHERGLPSSDISAASATAIGTYSALRQFFRS